MAGTVVTSNGHYTLFDVPDAPVKEAKKNFSTTWRVREPEWELPDYRSISSNKRIGLDIESFDPELTSKGPGCYRKDGKIAGVAIAYTDNDASYYPTAHDKKNVGQEFWETLRKEALNYKGEIVGANLQYDLDWLRAEQNVVFPHAKICDVQLAEPLIDETRLSGYSLSSLAKSYLGEDKAFDELKEIYGKDYIKRMHTLHSGHVAKYAEADTTLSWRIFDKQQEILKKENLESIYELESGLTPMLLEMKHRGVPVDTKATEEAIDRLNEKMARIQKKFSYSVDGKVDIWSSASVANLFEALNIKYPKTSKGAPSFRKPWLEAHSHPMVKSLIDARDIDKTVGTFLRNYILESNVDGRIHAQFNQLKKDDSGTVSGRFSSSYPNLQNIPSRHPEYGPLLRSIFIPEEGMLWGSLDWSQIEYRLLVHYAEITVGINATDAVAKYRDDPKTDFHQMASELTGVERSKAKSINFGVVYGMGAKSLASHLKTTEDDAKSVLSEFHKRAPFIKGMLDRLSNVAADRGYIKTILGRRRRFKHWEVNFEKGYEIVHEDELENFFERFGQRRKRRAKTYSALNALLQGSAADIMKQAMRASWDAGLYDVLVPHITVHDELNVSVPDTNEGREAFKELHNIMCNTVELEVPLLVDSNIATNWSEAK